MWYLGIVHYKGATPTGDAHFFVVTSSIPFFFFRHCFSKETATCALEMRSSFLLVVGSSALPFASGLEVRQGNWTVGQTVQTNSGPVSGHPATNQSSVSEYLGIPYAQPPIGDLRFAAPANFTGTAPLNGTDFVSGEALNHYNWLMNAFRVSHVQ
jgi:hypothetical protein